ncbi:hypothetical protein N658DRAFT_525172 [Parathielavia hyrcaniae]|uniref:Uncharacterized protein n=1 Tax=Parathielavia hyrcaniae TaxID=113614 RepID=A0AAN6SZW7_9PEZI|nr:hypothetical protein N658DRAFT_525172 [Parathielavia hyrcaniae]
MAIAGLLFFLSIALVQAQGDNKTPALDPDVIQAGSSTDGTDSLGTDPAQFPSSTSNNNFINFCKGQTLTNGLQITGGSLIGQIPSANNMISVVITNPQNGDSIESGQDFDITLQVSNMEAGAFTNPAATYYGAPQQLARGMVVGHVHVTVQNTGPDLNPSEPLDPTQFAFFKGINDAGAGRGRLSTTVTGGLPAGNYRLCTITSAANHQPVIMPVAQRGSQDDCVRFTVTGNVNVINPAANNGGKGLATADLIAQAVALGPDAPDPGSNNYTGGGGNNGGGRGNNNDGDNNDSRGGQDNREGDNNRGRNSSGHGGNDDNKGDNNSGEGTGRQASSATAAATPTSLTGPAATPRAGNGEGRRDPLALLSRRRRFIA